MKENDLRKGFVMISNAPALFSFWYGRLLEKNSQTCKKSTFYVKNQNSEHTFVSSTLKVEEIKVPSELVFLP